MAEQQIQNPINEPLCQQATQIMQNEVQIQKKQNTFNLRDQVTNRPPKKQKKLSSGKWNDRETRLFLRFVKYNIKSFKVSKRRRKKKIFQKMSDFVRSRSADQCRSHLQKVLHHYQSLESMLNGHLPPSIELELKKIRMYQDKMNQKNLTQKSQEKKLEVDICQEIKHTEDTQDADKHTIGQCLIDQDKTKLTITIKMVYCLQYDQ